MDEFICVCLTERIIVGSVEALRIEGSSVDVSPPLDPARVTFSDVGIEVGEKGVTHASSDVHPQSAIVHVPEQKNDRHHHHHKDRDTRQKIK